MDLREIVPVDYDGRVLEDEPEPWDDLVDTDHDGKVESVKEPHAKGHRPELARIIKGAEIPKHVRRQPRPLNLIVSMAALLLVVMWQSLLLIGRADRHRFLPKALEDAGLSHHEAYVGTQIYLVTIIVGTAILTLLVLGGFTHARDALMALLTVAILMFMLDRSGMRIVAVGHNNLMLTTVTIIALLALSSDEVRDWIRGHEPSEAWGPVKRIRIEPSA